MVRENSKAHAVFLFVCFYVSMFLLQMGSLCVGTNCH